MPPTMAKQKLIERQIDVALGMHEAGASQRVIAEQLSVSQTSLTFIPQNLNYYFQNSRFISIHKRSITDRTSHRIARLALKLPRISLQDLINRLDINLSKKTITLHLKHLGIQKRIAYAKPYLSPQHMIARLEWAKTHEIWIVLD